MNDLIDRELTIEWVRATINNWLIDIQEGSYKAGFSMGAHIAMQTIANDVPPAGKTGKWLYYLDNGQKRCKCSECLTSYGCLDTPYCPNCGAKMEV